jgi:digeranylgeranylglycerophospholipid reductase
VTNGEKNGIKGADPKVLLDDYIDGNDQLREASTLLDFGGVISVGAPMDEFVKDNFMVIGTAAKQVDPIHGGGIALAMETAALAAATVIGAHKKKDFSKTALMPYETEWKATLGKKMVKRLLLRKVMEKLNDGDLDYIFNTITDRDLNEVMDGKFAAPVAKVVAGRPQLLKVLGALLS